MSMDTTYCDNCGILHDPEDGDCMGCKQNKIITLLKESNEFYGNQENWGQGYSNLFVSEENDSELISIVNKIHRGGKKAREIQAKVKELEV